MSIKLKITAIVIASILVLSALAGGITAIVLNEINKSTATTETDYAVTENLFNTNGTINTTAVTQLLAAINYDSYTASTTGYTAHNLQNRTSNNSGNTIIFPMGYVSGTSGANLYWQATYLYNGYLTVWLDKAYTNSTWNASSVTVNYNSYASSTIQNYLDDTFWPLLTQNSATLRGIFATPAQAGYQTLASGTTNDTSYSFSTMSSSTTVTSRFDNMSTTVGNSSYLWLPSFGEVFNNTSSEYTNDTTHYTGQWGLNITDRSFNEEMYLNSGTVTSFCWLRSGATNWSKAACHVSFSGPASQGSSIASLGVRPAAHISLSVLQQYVRYNVTTAVSPAGAGSASGGSTNLVPNSSLTLTASETNPAYEFVGWSLDGGNSIISGSEGRTSYPITVTQDATYTAVFRLKSYSVTTSTDGNGSITASTTVTHGGSFEVTATPINETYEFDYFILNGNTGNPIRSNPYTITNITANTTITAYFKLDTRTITLQINNDTYGIVSGGGAHTLNSDVVITATANAGYSFVGWSLDGGKTLLQDSLGQTEYTITVTQDATYTAVFESGITITSANPDTEFSITREVNNGIRHRYTIQTNSGYYIERIALINNNTTPTEEEYQDILSTDGYLNTDSYCMGLHYITNTTGTELVLEVYYSTTPFTIYLDFTTEPQNYKSSGSVDGVAVSVLYTGSDTTELNSVGEARIKGYTTIDGVEYVTLEAIAYTGYTFVGWQVDGEFISYTDDTTGTITLTGSAYRTADIPLSLIDGEQVVAIFE